MAQPFLSLQQLTVRHLQQTVFENLNFEVLKGEHWALVGESGSGKTALLQTIAGQLNITRGQMLHLFFDEWRAHHQIQEGLFTYRNLIAQVSQKHSFRNLSNVSEFYYQQRYHAADSEDAPTVDRYLGDITSETPSNGYWTYNQVVDTFRLTNLLDKQLIKLSNGETKRLLLASALLKQPQLLLLDQPLTGLDVKTRAEFNQLISRVVESGITVVMATSPTEIPEAITHVAVLQNCEIVSATPKTLYVPVADAAEEATLEKKVLKDLLSIRPAEEFNTTFELQGVSIRYGQKQVLDNIWWQVQPGERWALLGHNGAGKTTLLSLINGDNPQAYSQPIILFDKKRGSGETIWDIKKRIGFVSPELFQYFPPHNTCVQVVESGFYDTLGLLRPSEPDHAALALRWMKLLGVEEEAHKPFKHASASAQRLSLLARALAKNPPLLILDEPCQGLDHSQQEHFKQLLNAICAQSDVTMVYVTHYQEELPECITKVLQLENGKVLVEQQDSVVLTQA